MHLGISRTKKMEKLFLELFVIKGKKFLIPSVLSLKYIDGFNAGKIADIKVFSDERSVYKQIDRDMVNFGAWLVSKSDESKSLETIRKHLETVIFTEYEKRGISVTDKKAWNKLSSDIIKALSIG